ncbi:MAG: fused signal recognition particle receptor, partial [Methylobacteriaceae bacterium]|nr:fused signal recognition particle receptor [Methylobacteriaceae bacterium]
MSNEDVKESRPGFFGRLFRGAVEPEPQAPPPADAPSVIVPELPVIAPEPAPPPAALAEPKQTWWKRLSSGLSRSSAAIGQGITDVFTKRKLDVSALEDLEDVLVRADLGVAAAQRISEAVGRGRYDREIDPQDVRSVLAEEVERTLVAVAEPLKIDWSKKPFIVLVVGVNGSGKTTTIAKLAHLFTEQDYSVLLVAGDTFRAAAIEQLRIWADRAGVPIIAGPEGSDSSAIVYDGVKRATAEGIDVLIVDTAGRLQNKK